MILLCGCASGPGGVVGAVAFQDAKYGTGMRVHTPMVKKDPPMFRCTVCLKERAKPGKAETAKEKKAREKQEQEAKEKESKTKKTAR